MLWVPFTLVLFRIPRSTCVCICIEFYEALDKQMRFVSLFGVRFVPHTVVSLCLHMYGSVFYAIKRKKLTHFHMNEILFFLFRFTMQNIRTSTHNLINLGKLTSEFIAINIIHFILLYELCGDNFFCCCTNRVQKKYLVGKTRRSYGRSMYVYAIAHRQLNQFQFAGQSINS